MQLDLGLDFEELLACWIEYRLEESVILVSRRRDDKVLELFDGDGSDYVYDFEQWLQLQVAEAIREDCNRVDWHAIARRVAEEITGSYTPLPKEDDSCT
jgi:hypothetical protein